MLAYGAGRFGAVLFDIYRPKPDVVSGSLSAGEKSLAVRLVLNSDEASLTDVQIESTVKSVLDHLALKLAARLRT